MFQWRSRLVNQIYIVQNSCNLKDANTPTYINITDLFFLHKHCCSYKCNIRREKCKQKEINKKLNKLYLFVIKIIMSKEDNRTLLFTEERAHATENNKKENNLIIKANCE